MYNNSILYLALSAVSLVSAHGKVQVVTGDQGGNGTALGIEGGSVARFGANGLTEKDTTVFGGDANKPKTDGLGTTAASGKLTVSDLAHAVALSGSKLPQVSGDGTGSINGTWRIVTSDGTANNEKGNLFVVIDETGTGKYSSGIQLTATSAMVGDGQGNVVQRTITRSLQALGIQKRATNVGADASFSVQIPVGLSCNGSDSTSQQTNFCLMKIANNNGNGPFGGNIAFQIASNTTSNAGAAKCGRSFQA